MVDKRSFGDAVRDLDLKWNNSETNDVFGWIADAFNENDGVEPKEIDQAVDLLVRNSIP